MFDSHPSSTPDHVPGASLVRVAFIGTFPPQQCGIATFTCDLREALEKTSPLSHPVVPVAKAGEPVARGALARIDRDDEESYREAARVLNGSGVSAVCIQHEFGIFGGPSGLMLEAFLDEIEKPVVTTLHTVLPDPSDDQRRAMSVLIEESARLVTMTCKGAAILRETYEVPEEKIVIVPHGYPARPPQDRDALKARYGLSGRKVLLTFGLLSPGKGLETAIDALPAIVGRAPETTYLIAGATHPAIVANEGEAYRERLQAKIEALGVQDNVRFVNSYLDTDELLDYLQLADAYVTPYPNVRQITSGTLTFAFGMGLPIVSTPYWHAEELLADGHGRLVPFGASDAIAEAVSTLFTNEGERRALSEKVLAAAQGSSWPAIGERYAALFTEIRQDRRCEDVRGGEVHLVDFRKPRSAEAAPPMTPSYGHLLRMTDSVGIAQHARFKVPDRDHGYCIDDCARVLIACAEEAGRPGSDPRLLDAVSSCAAFVEHAWNKDEGKFRNFLGYDRRWLERAGSDDSNGRTLWALGVTSVAAHEVGTREWASHLRDRTSSLRGSIESPRARAFCVLGEAARGRAGLEADQDVLERFGASMMHQRAEVQKRAAAAGEDWVWFETSMAYDNARLCEALIAAGEVCGERLWTETALEALAWLVRVQDRGTHVNFVGTEAFGRPFVLMPDHDEQPVEAAATIDACAAAFAVTRDARWLHAADDAFAWFAGRNRLGAIMVDASDGACRDGLHETRINGNCGAESVLAYAQAARAMSALRAGSDDDAADTRAGA